MKSLAITAFATLAAAATSFAGTEVTYKDYKGGTFAEPCFKDVELQLDVFGTYNDVVANDADKYDDGFGGGIGVNYFFSRYVGVGVDGNVWDADVNGLWQTSGKLILRYPIEGSLCVAPYVFGGGGVQTNGETVGSWHAGGGLEWRATHSFGVFGEGRYTWTADTAGDTAQARVGLRFVF